MPALARLEPEKEQRHDGMHGTHAAGDAHQAAPVSQAQLEVDGRASDAAIHRMLHGSGDAVGGNGTTTTTAHAPSAGDSGMVTGDLTVKMAGADVKVPKGTYVVVKEVKG